MARTKSFKELVQQHVKGDPKFAEALLREGVEAMLSGDVETGKAHRTRFATRCAIVRFIGFLLLDPVAAQDVLCCLNVDPILPRRRHYYFLQLRDVKGSASFDVNVLVYF
jgi:hypothetical protein